MGSFGGFLLHAEHFWHLKGMPQVQEENSELVCSLSLTLDLEPTTLLNLNQHLSFSSSSDQQAGQHSQSYGQMTVKIVVSKERESTR